MQVVVLNWNNYLGRGDEYVAKMRSMVSRHLTIPHEFVIVTEKDLPPGKDGWFNKLSLLEMFDDEVLYLDLDVIVSGSIDSIVETARTDPTRIWARDDFSYSAVNPKPLSASDIKYLGAPGTINSSVMWWKGKRDMTAANQYIAECHGDQGIITKLFWPDGIGLLPNDSVRSYKYHYRRDGSYGPITVFHGQPKMHEVRDQWVIEHWR